MIRYFVSYYHTDGHGRFGFGNSGLSLPRPIRSIDDLTALADEVQRNRGLSNVVILNWRRFEEA